MSKPTDIMVHDVALHLLPIETRMPIKFGAEVVTAVTCARVCMTVRNRLGQRATGWGETPLSVQWAWPGRLDYEPRHHAMKQFSRRLVEAWAALRPSGHALEIGHFFIQHTLPAMLESFNRDCKHGAEAMPHLAALVCCSAFDLAMHDAYGKLVDRPVYQTYDKTYMSQNLADFLDPIQGSGVDFAGRYPADFLLPVPAQRLRAWHLVGGLDPLTDDDRTGCEPDDGHPVVLTEWIQRDGLKCLKIKLRGTDAAWDYDRLVSVGRIAGEQHVEWLSADFNCTVHEPEYVNAILDRLRDDQPAVYRKLLYVEQPFPYELEQHAIDVRSVSARKPLFLDESAHDWRMVRLGRSLGWTGVALKTCKTQTGALLSLCWAKAHGMSLMVQDLANPMLAMLPHALLAAHAGTIMGVETNASQFYPDVSAPEAAIHPGLYRRRHGCIDLGTLSGAGFGYRIDEIRRTLPPRRHDRAGFDGGVHMKLIVFTKMMQQADVGELVRLANATGVEGYDLCVRAGYLVNPDNAETHLPRVVRQLREAGIDVPMVTGEGVFQSASAPASPRILAGMAAAGVKLYKLGYMFYRPRHDGDHEAMIGRFRDEIGAWARLAERYGVKVCYHTHCDVPGLSLGYHVGTSCAELHRLIHDQDPAVVGAYIGTGNLLVSGEAFEYGLAMLDRHLAAVELQDVHLERVPVGDEGEHRRHWTVAGEGAVPWAHVFDSLTARRFQGPLTMHAEFEVPPGESFERLLTREAGYFKRKRDRASATDRTTTISIPR